MAEQQQQDEWWRTMVVQTLERYYNREVTHIEKMTSGSGEAFMVKVKHKGESQNELIEKYVCKFLRPKGDKYEDWTAVCAPSAQGPVSRYLQERGILCQTSILTSCGSGNDVIDLDTVPPRSFQVLEFLPGCDMNKVVIDDLTLATTIGKIVGSMHKALKDFSNEELWPISVNAILDRENFRANIQRAAILNDSSKRKTVEEVTEAFTSECEQYLEQLETGICHGDLWPGNFIVLDTNGEMDRTNIALIDFGVTNYHLMIIDIARACACFGSGCVSLESTEWTKYFLLGYLSEKQIGQIEKDLMKTAICFAYTEILIQSTMMEAGIEEDPNFAAKCSNIWPQLKRLWAMNATDMRLKWFNQ